MSASEATIGALHEKLAEIFLAMLNDDEPVHPSILKIITGYVKDNGVTCQEDVSTSSKLQDRLNTKLKLADIIPVHRSATY